MNTRQFDLIYWLKALSLLTIWGAAALLVYTLFSQILLVGVAVFIAICMNPAVTFFARKVTRGNRLWATIIVYILLAAVVAFVILNVLPIFITQIVRLVERLPELYASLASANNPLGKMLTELDLGQLISDNRQTILKAISALEASLTGIIASVFGGILRFATVMSFAFLMVMHAPYWRRVSLMLIPKRQHEDVTTLASRMYRVATSYINGNLTISFIAAIATGIALMILGVPNAVALAIIVGIVDLLPSIGATLAGVIVVTLTLLMTGISDAILMTIFFLGYQAIENVTLQPLIYSKALKVQSLVILVAVFLVGSLFGIVGALLAIPITASMQILVKFYLDKYSTKTNVNRGKPRVKTA